MHISIRHAAPSNGPIYYSPEGAASVQRLYERDLAQLGVPYQSTMMPTRYGSTHVLSIGPTDAPPLVLFHGGNITNPLTLAWFRPLAQRYRIYAPDTIGHPGQSAQTRLSPRDDSYGCWVSDLLDGLDLERATLLGLSYGAGIIVRTAICAPKRIARAALLMPSGIARGPMWPMLARVVLPMYLYRLFPNRERLRQAVQPMCTEAVEEALLDTVGAVYRHVRIESALPRMATAAELAHFDAPTLIIAAEHDIFFPAAQVMPRAHTIFPNLVAAEALPRSGHIPSREGIAQINTRLAEFLEATQV